MADLGSSGRVRRGGRAHPLASEGASYDEGVVDGSDAAHHHTVELLDPIGGEARSEVVAREIEVDAAGEVGEAGRHEPVEAVLGEVEVAQRGEEADVGGAVAARRQSCWRASQDEGGAGTEDRCGGVDGRASRAMMRCAEARSPERGRGSDGGEGMASPLCRRGRD
jgi:hypothetical protein